VPSTKKRSRAEAEPRKDKKQRAEARMMIADFAIVNTAYWLNERVR